MNAMLENMVRSHPLESVFNRQELVECIDACNACAEICTSCADACLAESNVISLVGCIRHNLDCADVCAVTGRLLARQTMAETEALRMQVEVCAEFCRICAEECEQHARMMEHCQICADECRRCQRACNMLVTSAPDAV